MNLKYLILIILVHFCTIDKTIACDCLESGTVKTEAKRSNLVALVRTISQDTIKFINQYHRIDYKLEYRFLVIRKYKREIVSDTIIVSTPYGETACGFHFKINQKYILYGYEH